ncbi:hypothetical protein GCM10023331_09430 [Algivirga pacifica]|uniref:Capsule assembly protein Wzi n=2 Tax=Algivirga pacifica TaxID=1162670 RepID=A0ABP9D5R6_9BACT
MIFSQGGRWADQQASALWGAEMNGGYTLVDGKLPLKASYGVEGLLNTASGQSMLRKAYGTLQWEDIIIKAGLFEHTVEQHSDLSSGSLAISNNARPIPGIGIYTDDFMDVPFTYGFFQVKAGLGHFWMGQNRYVPGTLLHEKYLIGSVNGGKYVPVKVWGGLVHFGQWGGTHPRFGEATINFENYIRILLAQSANINDESTTGSDQVNALGNHLGIWTWGLEADLVKDVSLGLSIQKPYEDGSGQTDAGFRHFDGLYGMVVKQTRWSYLPSEFTFEYLNTTEQSGPTHDLSQGLYGGDNYYNNSYYRSGWTYNNLILGSPLMTTKKRESQITDEEELNVQSIINNRVKAFHIGLKGSVNNQLVYQLLATHSQNYGIYESLGGPYRYESGKNQSYLYLQLDYQLKKDWSVNASIAHDFGEIYQSTALRAGIAWTGLWRY